MPSKKQYNLVHDDAYDCRIPLYNEEAFQHGITYHAKYIGSLDVPRPTSRVEIVAAMRRIRHEFKAKSIKKKKVSMTISVDGVKVLIRSKPKNNQWLWDESKLIVMNHPIYRIFYVSHDSQDLKIFSYIARDGGTNAFKCNVFKSKKKSQAMRIVRTIGQAFEVCHKLSLVIASSQGCNSVQEEIDYASLPEHLHKGDGASEPNSCDIQVEEPASSKHQSAETTSALETNTNSSVKKSSTEASTNGAIPANPTIYFLTRYVSSLKSQVEAQGHQLDEVNAEVLLLRDQLTSESDARHETQAQNKHLLVYNRDLLQHIGKLVGQFQELEQKYHQFSDKSDVMALPEMPPLPKIMAKASTKAASLQSGIAVAEKAKIRSIPSSTSSESKLAEDHYSSAFHPIDSPSSFERSPSTMTYPIMSSSPLLESRNHYLIGQSLPGSPSRRNFTTESEAPMKSPSPFNNNVQFSKNRSLEGQSLVPGGMSYQYGDTSNGQFNRSPKRLKEKTEIFNYSPDDLSIQFKYNGLEKAHPGDKKLSSSHSMEDATYPSLSKWSAGQANQSNDSFIAQVARDLAKLQTTQVNRPQSESRFPSLFNKS